MRSPIWITLIYTMLGAFVLGICACVVLTSMAWRSIFDPEGCQ